MKYDFKAVEAKWQKIWDDEKTFAAKLDKSKPKFYALVEFPYPSGQGLHVGHPRSYTALDIVARVGGEENIVSVTHCVTRLRFVLKDESQADTAALNSMKGVLKVIQAGGQYQVVIGNDVGDVYDAVLANTGVKAAGEADAPKAPAEKSGKKKSLLGDSFVLCGGPFLMEKYPAGDR